MMSRSKSQRLKAVGKATLVPSIFNINEPVIFGTPIAWNFTLIIPFLLNSLIIPIIVYLVLSAGWVSIPDTLFSIYQMPLPIATWLVCPEVQGLILFAVVVVINSLIWFPFFKAYEHQCLCLLYTSNVYGGKQMGDISNLGGRKRCLIAYLWWCSSLRRRLQ